MEEKKPAHVPKSNTPETEREREREGALERGREREKEKERERGVVNHSLALALVRCALTVEVFPFYARTLIISVPIHFLLPSALHGDVGRWWFCGRAGELLTG